MRDIYVPIHFERKSLVILITKEEKDIIAREMPNVHIRRTVGQKSKRHKYYMEELGGAMRLLKKLRGGGKEVRR
jgi:hypothetical protein